MAWKTARISFFQGGFCTIQGVMKTRMTIPILWLAMSLAMLSGCATRPVSKSLRAQAMPLTLAQVTGNPDAYTGTVVIWGGQIINTVNTTNGGDIYVLKLSLDRQERPDRHPGSSGRFIAHRGGFIDPEIFKSGRLVTVAGAIAGTVTEPLQKTTYVYPIVGIEEIHLWERRLPSYYYPPTPWGWYGTPGAYWNWHGPGWGWYGPYQPGWIW